MNNTQNDLKLMVVESVFNNDEYTIVGRLERDLTLGQSVKLITENKTYETVIQAIYAYGRYLESASMGNACGLVLKDVPFECISEGDVLYVVKD